MTQLSFDLTAGSPALLTHPPSGSPFPTLAAAAAEAATCQRCPLGHTRTCSVFSDGSPTAPIMLIGEAPGQQEDETGTPFMGRAGQLLNQLLIAAGLDRATDLYICNTVKCRPPGNRKPTPAEKTACQPFLQTQVALVKPQLMVLTGATAVASILGKTPPISSIRGQWFDSSLNGVRAMPVFHPSYLLRYGSRAEGSPWVLTVADFQAVRRALHPH
jgi:uracil-DNA glycosylase